jgi:hypothetical protein
VPGAGDENFAQLEAFLKANESWESKRAMVGVLGVDGLVHVPRCRGTMKFIQYRQFRDDAFAFPPAEAVSLLFSRRLILLSESRAVSAHALLNFALSRGLPLPSLLAYAMFCRFCASARKPNPPRAEAEERPLRGLPGFAGLVESAAAIGPRRAAGYLQRLYPATQLIKAPENHGLPAEAALSLPGFDPVQAYDGAPILAPISAKCVVAVKPGPGVNGAMARLLGAQGMAGEA